MNNNYEVTSLTSLEKLEPVRVRPGMYIGSTGSKGLHHCIWEILDNSIDEISNGFGDTATVTLHANGAVTISDNGRGIPVGIHPIKKKSGVEMVFTELHTGGKFDNDNYKTSGGLHGVGAAVVNALSEWLEVRVFRDNKEYMQRFEYAFDKSVNRVMPGTPVTKLELVGATDKVGTQVTFLADKRIFTTTEFKEDDICERLQELSFQNKNITLNFVDERGTSFVTKKYHSEKGLLDFIEYLNENKKILTPKAICFSGTRNINNLNLFGEICVQFTDSTVENTISFVNNIPTKEAGTHETGFKMGMTRAFKDAAKNLNLLKDKRKDFEGIDLREGMTAIVLTKISNPIFEGQTKTKLGNPEATTLMNEVAYIGFSEWIEDNKDMASIIINNALDSAQRRDKIKKINEAERKKVGVGTSPLAGKIAVCTKRNPSVNEFIVVEGDSAGGSAKQARDRRFQAIMPSKGKIMNTEKQNLENVMASDELKIFNTAIGTGILDNFNISDMNYDKIIILSDADIDGYHIRTLWITYVYRYMREMIVAGKFYLAQPPLYKIYKVVKGKEIFEYAYNEQELARLKESFGENYNIQRYKGLGEMNPTQLWDTTLNPKTRNLQRVTINDAIKAEKTITLLMGDKVEPRKDYMYKYAQF